MSLSTTTKAAIKKQLKQLAAASDKEDYVKKYLEYSGQWGIDAPAFASYFQRYYGTDSSTFPPRRWTLWGAVDVGLDLLFPEFDMTSNVIESQHKRIKKLLGVYSAQ